MRFSFCFSLFAIFVPRVLQSSLSAPTLNSPTIMPTVDSEMATASAHTMTAAGRRTMNLVAQLAFPLARLVAFLAKLFVLCADCIATSSVVMGADVATVVGLTMVLFAARVTAC